MTVVLLLLTVGPGSASAGKRLSKADARDAAESKVFDFYYPKLDDGNVGLCLRKSYKRVNCHATAEGRSGRKVTKCELVVSVLRFQTVDHTIIGDLVYDHTVAKFKKKRCRHSIAPLLSADRAREKAQEVGDEFAGQPTEITYLSRDDDVTFDARAEWTRPGQFGTDFCSVDIRVRLSAGQVKAVADGFVCY